MGVRVVVPAFSCQLLCVQSPALPEGVQVDCGIQTPHHMERFILCRERELEVVTRHGFVCRQRSHLKFLDHLHIVDVREEGAVPTAVEGRGPVEGGGGSRSHVLLYRLHLTGLLGEDVEPGFSECVEVRDHFFEVCQSLILLVRAVKEPAILLQFVHSLQIRDGVFTFLSKVVLFDDFVHGVSDLSHCAQSRFVNFLRCECQRCLLSERRLVVLNAALAEPC
mmetsp:Transcript_53632/g.104869  ORF Transcript_53632/g.104869 Transcript_53632/m.104869 type:complete len:222 (-) Transcript_53632:1125-1790(-)